jgi:molecular chaperone GrpE
MKKPFRPSSTWARLSKAYRHRRGKVPPDAQERGPALVTSDSKSYTGSMDSTKQFVDSADAENGSVQPGDGANGSDTASSTADAESNLEAERDQLLAERAELQDRLLRRQAEFDNFRRRAERDRADVLEYANTETVRALLPILDDFERALKVESAGKDYARGMELIYQRLFDSLKKLGLEPITSTGLQFDPNIHHAVDRAETNEVEENTILEEYQRGYNFRGKMLRPAMVKVAVKS